MSDHEERFELPRSIFERRKSKRKERFKDGESYLTKPAPPSSIPIEPIPGVEIREDEIEIMSDDEASRDSEEETTQEAAPAPIPADVKEISEEELPDPIDEGDIPDEDVPEEERHPEQDAVERPALPPAPALVPFSPPARKALRKTQFKRPRSPMSQQLTGGPTLSQAAPGTPTPSGPNPANFLILLAGVAVIGVVIYFLKRR